MEISPVLTTPMHRNISNYICYSTLFLFVTNDSDSITEASPGSTSLAHLPLNPILQNHIPVDSCITLRCKNLTSNQAQNFSFQSFNF